MNSQITVFSTTYCPACSTLKQWFDKQQISYKAVNIEEEPDQQAEMIKKSGSFSTPVTLIVTPDGNEQVFVGLQYAEIKAALQL